MSKLNADQREDARRRSLSGQSFEEIGKHYGITAVEVSNEIFGMTPPDPGKRSTRDHE